MDQIIILATVFFNGLEEQDLHLMGFFSYILCRKMYQGSSRERNRKRLERLLEVVWSSGSRWWVDALE